MNNFWRKSFKKLHLWMGLPFWAILFFICITGTIAVISYELTWIFNPNVRASDGEIQSFGALISAIEAQVEGAKVMRIGVLEPYLNYLAYVVLPEHDGFAKVWIDPVSATVTQVSTGVTLSSFLRALHGWLLIPSIGGVFIGWFIVCFFALPLLISIITGLVIYKKFWKGFVRPKIHTDKGSRPFWISFHKIGGLYSLWLALIMSISSIWFIVIMILFQLHFPFDGAKPPKTIDINSLPNTQTKIDIDSAYLKALEKLDGLNTVIIPESSVEPIKFRSNNRTYLLNDDVSINQYTNEILEVRLGEDNSDILVISQILQALHFGQFGGLGIKLLWFVFGLTLSFLIFSGMKIYIKRVEAKGGLDEKE